MEEHIWYACYGSNINRERFLCYIDGKERSICGKLVKNKGCEDKSPPRENHPFVFNHDIYFAKTSNNWGGGVAFEYLFPKDDNILEDRLEEILHKRKKQLGKN